MLFRGRRLIKTAFVSILQQLFTNHPKFPWNKNILETKITIDEDFQISDRKFPYIIITDVSNNDFFKASYDRDFQHEDYNKDGVLVGARYGGKITPSFNFEFASLNKFDLEIIVDFVESFFEFAGVQKLRYVGIVIQSVNDSGIITETYGKDNIYKLNMTFNIYTEWEKYITQDEMEIINAVNVEDIILFNKNNITYIDKPKD